MFRTLLDNLETKVFFFRVTPFVTPSMIPTTLISEVPKCSRLVVERRRWTDVCVYRRWTDVYIEGGWMCVYIEGGRTCVYIGGVEI
jgi:hypothetical protein